MIKILLFLDWLVGNNLAWAGQQKTYADLRIWFIFFLAFRITLKEVVKLAHFLVFSGPKWLGKASMKTKTQFCISVCHQVRFGAFKFDIFGFCEFFGGWSLLAIWRHFWHLLDKLVGPPCAIWIKNANFEMPQVSSIRQLSAPLKRRIKKRHFVCF